LEKSGSVTIFGAIGNLNLRKEANYHAGGRTDTNCKYFDNFMNALHCNVHLSI